VVDDDAEILAMLEMTLGAEGFIVKTGRDGRNILQKALEFQPDLIMADLMMPGGGGYEVLRSLQGDDLTRKTPVLIITGYEMNSSTKDMMKLEPNMAGYMEKPLRPYSLTSRIHEILNTKTPQEEQMEQNQQGPPAQDFGKYSS